MSTRDWNLAFLFEPKTFMIGLRWKRIGNCVDVYLVPLPFCVIHFSFWGERWGMKEVQP